MPVWEALIAPARAVIRDNGDLRLAVILAYSACEGHTDYALTALMRAHNADVLYSRGSESEGDHKWLIQHFSG